MKRILFQTVIALIFLLFVSPAFAERDPVAAIGNDVSHLIKDAGNLVQDGVISAAVVAKLSLDKNLAQYDIDVTAHGGVVTLAGIVNSDIEANQMIQIASATEGVKAVDSSQLKIKKDEQVMADIAITSKVKSIFIKEKLFGSMDVSAMHVSVETKNGIVYLSGTVDNIEQAENAVKLAQSIQGVVRVDSSIIVRKQS